MRKSKPCAMLFVLAALFVAASAAFAISETWASPVYDMSYEFNEAEHIGEPGEGKVVPLGWCAEHGYLRIQNPDNPYVCPHCD